MDRKPEIQYVGQFYVLGSEAVKPAEKQKKKKRVFLPKPKHLRQEVLYLDPVALAGMFVALVMLVVLIVGAVKLENSWSQYTAMSEALEELRTENAQIQHSYRTSLDLEEVRTTAEGMGMIPKEEAQTASVWVTVPEEKTENTWWDNLVWFVKGLFGE